MPMMPWLRGRQPFFHGMPSLLRTVLLAFCASSDYGPQPTKQTYCLSINGSQIFADHAHRVTRSPTNRISARCKTTNGPCPAISVTVHIPAAISRPTGHPDDVNRLPARTREQRPVPKMMPPQWLPPAPPPRGLLPPPSLASESFRGRLLPAPTEAAGLKFPAAGFSPPFPAPPPPRPPRPP
jgi:hypothetical protein